MFMNSYFVSLSRCIFFNTSENLENMGYENLVKYYTFPIIIFGSTLIFQFQFPIVYILLFKYLNWSCFLVFSI
jgi:hypothetical protein